MQVNYSLIKKELLNTQLIQAVEAVQFICKSQIIITSGFRTVAEDKLAGASGNSAHVRGLAVDIRCHTSQDRYNIMEAVFKYGIKRIGNEVDHIHIDIDKSLPNSVLWVVV